MHILRDYSEMENIFMYVSQFVTCIMRPAFYLVPNNTIPKNPPLLVYKFAGHSPGDAQHSLLLIGIPYI